ncbi:hypothetical protein [Sphingobacterium sp.]|uniref:hypothetical protein n=1 Tax=Sphingobacterium sp. TaxID=341027 RepID=UPI0031D2F8CE
MTFECFASSQNNTNLTLPQIKRVSKDVLPLILFLESNFFKRIRVDGASGLRIYFVENLIDEEVQGPFKGIQSWINYYMPFNFTEYFNLKNSHSKKLFLIDKIKAGILNIANQFNWNRDLFLQIFDEIDALEGKLITYSKKYRLKGLKTQAQIEICCETGYYQYNLLLLEKDSVISKHHIVTLNAYYNIFFEGNRIISEMKWEDENTFVILGKKGELERIRFEYKLEKDTLTRIFTVEPAIVDEFMEEFDLATTTDEQKIQIILNNMDTGKWHIYI